MIRVTCASPTITLHLPPCATALQRAMLTRRDADPIELVIPPVDAATQNVTLAIPPGARHGVWELSLQSECGCYQAPIFVDDCARPQNPGQHIPSEGYDPVPECCGPDPNALHLTTLTVTPYDPFPGGVTIQPMPLATNGKAWRAKDPSNGVVIAQGTIALTGNIAILYGVPHFTSFNLEVDP